MRTTPFVRLLLCCTLAGLLLPVQAAGVSDVDCDVMAQQSAQWQSELPGLAAAEQAFESLFKGQLPDDTLAISRVLAPIGVERSAAESRTNLRAQRVQLLAQVDRIGSEASAGDCDEQAQLWQFNQRKYLRAQISLIEAKLALLKRPPSSLFVLYRGLKAWQSVQQVMQEVNATAANLVDAETAILVTYLNTLTNWSQQYRQIVEAWLPLFLAESLDIESVNNAWHDSRALKTVSRATQWPPLEREWPELSEQWQVALGMARSELVLSVSKWRNEAVWQAGWTHFFVATASPVSFTDALLGEVLATPINFWDNLSAPFLREYRYRQSQNGLAGLITEWFLQTAMLLFSLFLAVKLAGRAPAMIAELQQRSLQRLESASSSRLASGLFWFIKPNAPWLVALIVTQLVASQADVHSILSWVGPAGLLYALFRITRVIFEWLISRTYSRTGEFISPNAAQTIVRDCQYFAWAIVACGGVWLVGIGTGGGYLRYLIAIASVIFAWWALQWLLYRHREEVDQFISKSESHDKPVKVTRRMRIVRFIYVPVKFLVVHLIDALNGLNQKLLAFDAYRSFSVKLLRARLESKVEEEGEDESEPDENYSDWMMRRASESMVFEVGDPSRVLEPMQHWFKDKTDENVIMLVGEAGSGKTTFVERLPALWSETEVRFIRFETKTNQPQAVLDAIAEALDQERISDVSELVQIDEGLEQRVIVIDEAQNLFLAEVGQFDAYKTLMQCMNAQLNNIFWVVVMHAPSWSYLSCVFAREQRISNVYRMSRWSPQEIRRMILSRHQGGKRRLRYNELLLSAASSNESTSVRSADSRVFNILWEQSGGNPMAAIELWLNAAKVKGRVVEIGVPQRPSVTPLSTMNNDLYFVFSAIVVHRRLSTEELMLATHFAEPIVRHALKQGINLGLIVRDDGGRYSVDSYWYGTLSSFLQRKNLLWV